MTKPTREIKNNRKMAQVSVGYLLEAGSLDDMRTAKQITGELIKYHWNYYSELTRQRSEIQDQIKTALIQPCCPFEFKGWQRAVKYKCGLHPLSTVGSLQFIGGRFNTGMRINPEIPFFPGLYLAKDKDTALQEHLGQEKISSDYKLSPQERALTNPSSETIVSVSGQVYKVFDLTQAKNLRAFVNLINVKSTH